MTIETKKTPAEIASSKALEEMYTCLKDNKDFLLEAGAGAGKTYSLIKALRFLIETRQKDLLRKNQQIACITFTNVAKEEIEIRIDRNPLIYCNTTHAFCWSLISSFQDSLRSLITQIPEWQDRIAEVDGIGNRVIEYNLGYRSIKDNSLMLHHDDIIPLTVSLMEHKKFRQIMVSRFPIILIDEYQDTNLGWIEAIKSHYIGQPNAPLFGFFGDHWQKIYGDGCGSITHAGLTRIGKEANFRSVKSIVDCLNRMRPQLPQFVQDETLIGQVNVFHTNSWQVTRQKGAHWGGDLSTGDAHKSLEKVKKTLEAQGWNFSSPQTKILMLTHRVLANEQGYPSLPSIFKNNSSFTKKEQPHIAFFVDILEPACEAFIDKKYGAMLEAVGQSIPSIQNLAEKTTWSTAMDHLLSLRQIGTVGEVIDYLRDVKVPRLPTAVEKREQDLETFTPQEGEDMPVVLSELKALREVAYSEIVALRKYLVGHSPFETKHGVKGAEFENVLVVVGRGWSDYNFSQMLEMAEGTIAVDKEKFFERNRNLLYVACSRPKTRLALLFTQELSAPAIKTLNHWFGATNIDSLLIN